MSDEAKEHVEEQGVGGWMGKIAQALSKATTHVSTQAECAIAMSMDAYAGSMLEEKVNEFGEQLEATGIPQRLGDTKDIIGEKIDEVTGKRLVDLLEVRLEKQDMYNDVLATRLAEALDRISQLEHEMQDLKRK